MKVRPVLALPFIAVCLLIGCGSDASQSGSDQSASVSVVTTTATTATAAVTQAVAGSPTAGTTATQTPASTAAVAGFVIQASGTNGVAFTGECRSGTSDGTMTPRPVSGTVPARIEMPGNRLSCSLRHGSASGTLRVQVERGGQIVNTSETSAGGEIQFQLALP